MKKLLFSLLLLGFTSQVMAYDPPTMGWSSWNTFALNINESTIKNTASAMKAQGYAKVGYIYCNIDDGYFGGRDKTTGQLLIHPTRFPNGLKPVVDYIHKLGLKAGIYSDGGHNTCGSYHGGDKDGVGVGLYEHDQQDCDFFFKELGFDFIKIDFCGGVNYHNAEGLNLDEKERYTAIHKAIMNTGRDDVRMNICRWAYPGAWAKDISCSWRTTGDIGSWWTSVRDILKENLYLSAYCREGHYNDMDMLEVGRGMTQEEDKTHFGMWCIMSSPLLIGCDIRNINTTTKSLLQNKELIAINQDSLGLQAYVVKRDIANDTYVLVKDVEELYGLKRVVALFNPTDEAHEISFDFADVCLGGQVLMRNLFTKKDIGTYEGSYSEKVPAHGTRIYMLTAEERYEQTLYEAETAFLQNYNELWLHDTDARTEDKSKASGGVIVSWLGKVANNDIVWPHVYSKEGGDYKLEISHFCGDSRKMTVNVNDAKAGTLTCSNKGWDTLQKQTINITLQPGENVIRLYNSSAYMPNIDCIRLVKKVPTGIENHFSEQKDENGYALNGVKIKEGKQNVRGVVIRNGKKYLR